MADVEVFIFAVEAELEAMGRERVGVHRRGCKPDLALRRRVIGLIWMLTFGGMQWRIAGLLSGIPFTTLHTSFARWSRLGLWRRLGQRLALDWRLACGDEVLPSAVVVDSRSLRSSPSAWARGFDGGKLVKGIKLFVASDKHGSLLDLELQPANTDDRAGILPTLPRLAALGFEGDLLGDSGFKGAPFAAAALAHDIHVAVSPGGTREGRFLPSGIRWVVERLFAWLRRYRRLNIVYDRAPDLFAAHIWIATAEVAARRPELVPGPGDGCEPRPGIGRGRAGRQGAEKHSRPAGALRHRHPGARHEGADDAAAGGTRAGQALPHRRTGGNGAIAGGVLDRPGLIHGAGSRRPSTPPPMVSPDGGVPSNAIQSGRVTADSRCSVVVSAAIRAASPPSARAMT